MHVMDQDTLSYLDPNVPFQAQASVLITGNFTGFTLKLSINSSG